MDMFPALYADIHDPDQRPQVIAQLRDRGLVTFSGIYDRAGLKAAARQSCPSGNVLSSSASTTRPETPRMIRSATGNCSGCCTPGG